MAKLVGVQLLAVWLISLALASPVMLLAILSPLNVLSADGRECGIFNRHFLVYGSLAAFFLPLLIMLVTYSLTIHLLRQRARACDDTRDGVADGKTPLLRRSSSKINRRRQEPGERGPKLATAAVAAAAAAAAAATAVTTAAKTTTKSRIKAPEEHIPPPKGNNDSVIDASASDSNKRVGALKKRSLQLRISLPLFSRRRSSENRIIETEMEPLNGSLKCKLACDSSNGDGVDNEAAVPTAGDGECSRQSSLIPMLNVQRTTRRGRSLIPPSSPLLPTNNPSITPRTSPAQAPRFQHLVKKHSAAIRAVGIMIEKREEIVKKRERNTVRTEKKAVKVELIVEAMIVVVMIVVVMIVVVMIVVVMIVVVIFAVLIVGVIYISGNSSNSS